MEKIKGKDKANASWARLIHKIFEVDPLLCPNCGKATKIIASITNHQEIKKNLKHIGEKTQRAPLLLTIPSLEPEDSLGWGSFLPDETYFLALFAINNDKFFASVILSLELLNFL